PDPSVWDGRFANNAWLQELPRPLTTITWDNAAYIGPATAQRLGVTNQDLVELRVGGRTVRAPIWIVPGQADDSVTLNLGYGRQAGRQASNRPRAASSTRFHRSTPSASTMGTPGAWQST